MIRTYFDGQKPLGNIQLSDSTSDNGDFISRQDILDELTRLRGEVERVTARAETAEAMVKELEAEVEKWKDLTGDQESERIKEKDRADRLQGILYVAIENRDMWESIASENAEVANKAEAQLAELRARVRPGVEEIADAVDREVDLFASDRNAIAKAISDILPPVPKVLSVEECKVLATELQVISERISSTAPDMFKNREEAYEWYEKTKWLEVEAHAGAIQKAMGGEE